MLDQTPYLDAHLIDPPDLPEASPEDVAEDLRAAAFKALEAYAVHLDQWDFKAFDTVDKLADAVDNMHPTEAPKPPKGIVHIGYVRDEIEGLKATKVENLPMMINAALEMLARYENGDTI